MRVEGADKLIRKLEQLPEAQKDHIKKAVQKSTAEGVRIASILAPRRSGKTESRIHAEFHQDGLVGEVVVISSRAPQEDKDAAYSIEHGRKKGNRGTTPAFKYVRKTRAYLAKRWKGRIKRAVRAAAKEVSRNG